MEEKWGKNEHFLPFSQMLVDTKSAGLAPSKYDENMFSYAKSDEKLF